ncbi:hypothetical protein D9C73_021865 [Collichthys lucidus]|uniref:Uncharacterized protein n=1 Tax=Collichthys lucidus TaxID=240159 RepID=A0A4U5VIT4_COLLU|nr:hypothetical protein D9C73_021865 [Collichthys lucidus]
MMEERKERGAALPLTAHRRGLRLCGEQRAGGREEEEEVVEVEVVVCVQGRRKRRRRREVDDEGGVPNGPDPQGLVELR